MLRKEKTIGHIGVTPSKSIEVREDTFIYEDDVLIAGPEFSRFTLSPGDSLEGQDELTVAIATALWNMQETEQ